MHMIDRRLFPESGLRLARLAREFGLRDVVVAGSGTEPSYRSKLEMAHKMM